MAVRARGSLLGAGADERTAGPSGGDPVCSRLQQSEHRDSLRLRNGPRAPLTRWLNKYRRRARAQRPVPAYKHLPAGGSVDGVRAQECGSRSASSLGPGGFCQGPSRPLPALVFALRDWAASSGAPPLALALAVACLPRAPFPQLVICDRARRRHALASICEVAAILSSLTSPCSL